MAPIVPQREILGRLGRTAYHERQELEKAYLYSNISTVAWRVRNLLELLVWIRYCEKSEELANKFLADAIRDTIEALGLADKFAVNDSQFADARTELIQKATNDGFQDIEDSYTWVSAAAKEIGAGDSFRIFNKLLSKFAHPTAMSVFSSREAVETKIKTSIYQMGVFFADHGMKIASGFDTQSVSIP